MTRNYCYTRLSADDMKRFDQLAVRLGYGNRTNFLTALVSQILTNSDALAGKTIVDTVVTATLEIENLRKNFTDILDEYAFPIIAMRGPEYAFKALVPDLQKWMYERCNAVPQTADMREWTIHYFNSRLPEIQQYRTAITTERYAMEQGGMNA